MVRPARSYLAMGPDYEELAEKTLPIVLDGAEVFTPEAPEFADALFLLGEAQNRRGDFERGIATLEEAMERYPDDRRVWKARFLLADGFRKSGLALKAEAADVNSAGEVAHMRLAASERFHSARDLYRLLISEYELRDSSQLGRLQQVYLRLAYFYEADCYFETRNYARALKLYEEAAGAHKDSTGALAAYVQIINTQVFLGEPEEARAALARALVLTDAIPDEAFARSVSPETRKDWKRYFGWLAEAELN